MMDGSWFERWVAEESGRVYSIALAHLGDPGEAEEIAQEACVRAWSDLGRLRDRTRFGPWLAAIVRNLCRDRRRDERRSQPSLDRMLEEGFDPVATPETRDERRLLAAMIGQLTPNQREVFALRYGANLNAAGIAEFLDLPLTTVETRLSRARRILAGRMETIAGRLDAP